LNHRPGGQEVTLKKGIDTVIYWRYIGATLAKGGDDEQAIFFKAFVKECKSWGMNHQVEFQLAEVNRLLTEEEKETLAMLSFKE